MRGGENMPGTHDCGGDAAAYVLGALEPAEAEAFRRHLENCAVCRDEVTALEQVANALPMAAPQHPVPPRLRRRILRAVHSERRRGAKFLKLPTARLTPSRAIAAAVVVALVVALAVAGVSLIGGRGTRVIQAQVAGIAGSAQLRLTGDRGELVVHHLSPPPTGRIYEVWLKRPGRPPAPANVLFGVSSAASSDIGLPGSLHGVNSVMVTPEPAGGSRVPTHSAVIVAGLS